MIQDRMRAGHFLSSMPSACSNCRINRVWSSVSRMVKLLFRPKSSACRRSTRTPMAWKVPSHMPSAAPPIRAATRSSISRAALLVKVTARICEGLALVLVQPVEMGRRCHGTAFRRGFGRHGVVGNFERIGGGRHAASYSNRSGIRLSFQGDRLRCGLEVAMARGVNGSVNGAGHVPTGREGVEARLPGVSNLSPAVAGVLPAVVGLRTTIPKGRRSAQTLGTEREGHGALIDDRGLIVTIGYLITDADTVTITDLEGNDWPAYIVGYDYESGFGLVRTERPIRHRPIRFGDSDVLELRSEAYAAGLGGEKAVLKVKVAGRREFAGYWEYLLDNAIFTVPA